MEKGYAVRAIRRSNKLPFYIPAAVIDKVEWIPGDLLDTTVLEEAMEGVSAVIHAAAKVSFVSGERREMFSTNTEGTANVVNAALAQNAPRLIHVSSVAALGRTSAEETIDEGKKWEDSDWNTNYALSKYHGETEIWRGIGEGLNAAIVNPSTILGYGDWNSSSCAIFKNVFREFPWYSNGVNGFVDVADVARAIVLLMESDISGERYIINGDNWSFRGIFDCIADGFGKKHPYREATPLLAGIAWRLEKIRSLFTGKPSLLSRETARIARSNNCFSNDKLLQQFPGFSYTPLQQTIRKACERYLEKMQPF